MKRPLVFKFVAAWCFVAAWSCLAMISEACYLPPGIVVYVLPLVIWQTVGLVQLKHSHRWLAVVFCVWWAIALVWNAAVRLPRAEVKLLTRFLILIGFNLLSAWYLSRPHFRKFAVQFLNERTRPKHSPLMQKVSEKRIVQDIQTMKRSG
jgi:hypothetical protein